MASTVLIPTIADDIHAAAVALVLEELGHRPLRWFCADFPAHAMLSAMPAAAGGAGWLRTDGATHDLDDVDIFWNRRVGQPVLDAAMHAGDRRYALREAQVLLTGTLELVSRRSFAVNPTDRVAVAENKAVQLAVAHELGFALPPTLMSNDPARIRAFLRAHAAQGTIFKTFRPVTWESGDAVAMLYTSPVTEDALPEDEVLRLGPAIFQARVPKSHELRVTCMGDELFAARLDSQATIDGQVDWRIAPSCELGIAPVALPPEVRARCRALLRKLGLVFGCIDMIVTPAGEHVFLEVNQMGQFLWVEETCPDFPLLQTFCDFLLSRDPAFRRRPDAPVRFRFRDVRHRAQALLDAERGAHLRPAQQAHVVLE